MGKIQAETCGVCRENPSKYRCPGCTVPYCSLVCNKAHKTGTADKPPCSGKRARPEDAKKAQLSIASQATTSDPLAEKRPRNSGADGASDSSVPVDASGAGAEVAAPCFRKSRDQWRGGKLNDDAEEEWAMSADQRGRISQCGWLKAALRDPKLQGLLVSFCPKRLQ